ncbi:MAG: type 4a pilus biogenesis protein PilO [Gemmatimonadota bacterium]
MALLPQDPKKQKQLVVAMLPLLLAFAYYQFYHKPRMVEVEAVSVHVEELAAKNAGAQALVATYGEDLPRRLALYQEHIRQLEELIPRREDVPVLIDMITQQAERLDIDMTALNPAAERPGEFYSTQVYELRVLGDYHAIGAYLTAIGSLARIVRPENVNINVENEGGGGLPRLSAAFRIQTYIMPAPAGGE